MLFDIRQYIQLLVHPVSGLIEGGAEEHEQVADFEHGIVLYCAAAYFTKSGGSSWSCGGRIIPNPSKTTKKSS